MSSPINPLVLSRQLLTMRNIAPELYDYGTQVRNAINSLNSSFAALSAKETSIASAPAAPSQIIALPRSTTKNLGGTVTVPATTLTLIDSIAFTFPNSGGPWRALVTWNYYKSGGINYLSSVSDATAAGNVFWASDYGTTTNNISFVSGTAVSSAAYQNGQSKTFYVYVYDTGASTIQTSFSGVLGMTGTGYMQVTALQAQN